MMDLATHPLATAEEIIADARAGRMVILVDDEDRENEGDLVIPADCADAAAINFMALHGRGLICLAMDGPMVDRLGLPLMTQRNQSRHETAFTISIEAREGVTTGISAGDRARTVASAINPASTSADICSPGHVFPLRAKEGGVLVRAGHTEASVDLARLAGRSPAGVICEIMNEDGSMARLPDLVVLAERLGLRIGTIRDLIAFRRRTEGIIELVEEGSIRSIWGGDWRLHVYRDHAVGEEHYALSMGDLGQDRAIPVRMHVLDPLQDILGLDSRRAAAVPDAMRRISELGFGAIVMLRDHSPTAISQRMKPVRKPGERLRQHGIGAEILRDLGLRRIDLLTRSPAPDPVALRGFGLEIEGVLDF